MHQLKTADGLAHRAHAPHAVERPDLPAAEPKLRICTLAACPFPANHGTPGSIRELSEAVAERGHDVHVVTYHMGQDIPLKRLNLHRIR